MPNFLGYFKDKWREYRIWCGNREFIAQKISERQGANQLEQDILVDFKSFFKESIESDARNFLINREDFLPCLNDKTPYTGFDRHYIYHLAWAARILNKIKPASHVDISSSLYFSSIISAFIPLTFIDYRPARLRLHGLMTASANLTDLPFADNSFESISCMHVLEHVGLGRYGDPLDPLGDLAAIDELIRVTALGGSLLVVVPVGRKHIAYNAHRVYDNSEFINYFSGMQLVESALIGDESSGIDLVQNAPQEICAKQEYGCGCYYFKKMR